MKKIILTQLILSIFFISNIFSETMYLTPQKNNTITFKNYSSITKSKNKLSLGEVYNATTIKNGRIFIPSLNSWVKISNTYYDYNETMIGYKADYLKRYKDDKQKEIKRRKNIVKENPQWSKKIKKQILSGMIEKNWPESLFVASWGKPNRKLIFTNKEGINEKRLLYGQKLYIFENDSLKYEKLHFTSDLKVHLVKEDHKVSSEYRNVNDSTLVD